MVITREFSSRAGAIEVLRLTRSLSDNAVVAPNRTQHRISIVFEKKF